MGAKQEMSTLSFHKSEDKKERIHLKLDKAIQKKLSYLLALAEKQEKETYTWKWAIQQGRCLKCFLQAEGSRKNKKH